MKNILYTFLTLCIAFSCSKQKDDVSPANNTSYNWTSDQAISRQDTMQVNNGALYVSLHSLPPHSTQQVTLSWFKQELLKNDFDVTINYEELQGANSTSSLPFAFMLRSFTSTDSALTVNIGPSTSHIQWGNTASATVDVDNYVSSSGTIRIIHTGTDFSVSVTKNPSDGSSTPHVQTSTRHNFFSDNGTFTFTGLNDQSQRASIRWTSFSITNSAGTTTESFDASSIHY